MRQFLTLSVLLFFGVHQMSATHLLPLAPFRFLLCSSEGEGEAVLTDLRCVCSLHRSELQRGRERERAGDNSDMASQSRADHSEDRGRGNGSRQSPSARMATKRWLCGMDGRMMMGCAAFVLTLNDSALLILEAGSPLLPAFLPPSQLYLCGFL